MAAQIPADYVDGDGPTIDDMNNILAFLRETSTFMATQLAFQGPRYVKTPVGGIAAGSSALCTVASRSPISGAMTDGTAQLKVWHHPGASTAVGGSRYIVVDFVQGVWQAIVEAC